MSEQLNEIAKNAISSFVIEGETQITDNEIHLPFVGEYTTKRPCHKYSFESVETSSNDYFPEILGECKIGVIKVVNQRFPLNVAFKIQEASSPYKILS